MKVKQNHYVFLDKIMEINQKPHSIFLLLRKRPGRGGVAEDFQLSSNIVSFAEGQTESCIDFTANIDATFDWIHEIVLDFISSYQRSIHCQKSSKNKNN